MSDRAWGVPPRSGGRAVSIGWTPSSAGGNAKISQPWPASTLCQPNTSRNTSRTASGSVVYSRTWAPVIAMALILAHPPIVWRADPDQRDQRTEGTTMAHEVRGVIARGKGDPVTIETVVVPDPGPGEALVAVQACGVCHTDLHY